MKLLHRASARHLSRHAWQTALAVLGVGLGVAVVLAVDLAVSSARRGFTLSAETIAGAATHQVVAGPAGLPDTAFAALRRVPGVRAAAPVIDGDVVAGRGDAARVVRVLGVDPFSEAPFRRYSGGRIGGGEASGNDVAPGIPAAEALIGRKAALLSRTTAASLGVREGSWLRTEVAGRADSARVAGILAPADEASRLGLENLLLMDVGTAQALLDRTGLDRIDLVLAGDAAPGRPGTAERVRAALPAGATLQEAGAAAGALREMTRAFDLNLRALSLLALVFGVFLIYNSVTFSVVQRRRLLGTLRALGATRRQIFGVVQLEALALGVAGAVLGLGLGVLLGSGLVRLVTRTIQDLYFVVTVRELILTPVILTKGVVLGIVGTLLAAVPPAWEASTTSPGAALVRSRLETGLRSRLPALSAAGLAMAGIGLLVLLLSSTLDLSFAGLFGVIIGLALLTPMATVALMSVLQPVAGAVFGVLGRLAAGGVTAGLTRTAPAIAALTIAVAVTIGIAVMVGSFRGSVSTWLGRTLSADIYVAPLRPGGTGGATGSTPIDPAAVAVLASDPDVAEVRRYRRGDIPTADGAVSLMAIEIDSRLSHHFDFVEGRQAEFWDDFVAGRVLLASEPFAYRRGLGPGDSLTLETDRGAVRLPIAGVFRDYGSDRGLIMISYDGYRRLWDDPTISTVALNLEPGADEGAVLDRLRRRTAPIQALSIESNVRVREASLLVFDRTFAITQVLRLLALIVAFVGVLSALMALQLERGRELGVLRANGLTPRQVWAMVASQTGLMGLVSGLMAVPIGLILAVLMIEFINRRSFGWTMDLAVTPGALAQAVALAVAASLLAGVYPSWRMARTSPAEALRGE